MAYFHSICIFCWILQSNLCCLFLIRQCVQCCYDHVWYAVYSKHLSHWQFVDDDDDLFRIVQQTVCVHILLADCCENVVTRLSSNQTCFVGRIICNLTDVVMRAVLSLHSEHVESYKSSLAYCCRSRSCSTVFCWVRLTIVSPFVVIIFIYLLRSECSA